MSVVRDVDRREQRSRAFQLGQPLFIQVPKRLAATVVAACALCAVLASQLTDGSIGYGPVFLVICAFGAWFVGNRYAVTLGLFAVTIQLFNGRLLVIRDVSTAAVLDLALQLCSALAVVLMLGVARVALEIEWRFARFDALTGALNRKAFFEAMEAEIGHQGMVALIFADLDGLKGLNDRLGHEAGDQALVEFAGYVRGAIRKDDLFARIGGDEFVVFMRVRDVAAAERVATRLNRVINVDMQGGVGALKCSLGTLILPQGSRSIDMELRQADALMYMAKRAQTGVMMAVSDESCTGAPVPPIHASPSPVSQTIVRSSKQRHAIPSAVAGSRVNPSIA